MRSKPLLLLALLLLPFLTAAQNDLRGDRIFFQNRQRDYAAWLDSSIMGRFLQLDRVQVTPQKVTLLLHARFDGPKAGDSLRAVWKGLRRAYYQDTRQELHAALLTKMAFQMDLPLDSVEIVLHAPGSAYQVRIYGERTDGQRLTARWEEVGDKGMANGTINIPVGQLSEVFRSGNTALGEKPGVDMAKVRRAIRTFLSNHYGGKGTDWLWTARIDSSSALYNDISYTISRISREVLKSHNFFELHQIDIKAEVGENGLSIFWTFQAKYGGGLIYPPHEDSNDYHDFETSPYKEQFTRYQTRFFRELEAQFKRI